MEGERFGEYEICFSGPCRPERIGFAPSLLTDGGDRAYPLRSPYVCIEPWTSLPGRDGVTEEFLRRSDMIQLAPNDTREFRWNIEAL